MDAVRGFHQERIRDHLIRSIRSNKKEGAVSADWDARKNPLRIPEILLAVLEFTTPHDRPALRLVSKLWSKIGNVLLWRHVSIRDNFRSIVRRIIPFLNTNKHLIRSFDFSYVCSVAAISYVMDACDSSFPALTSLILQDSDVTKEQLVGILRGAPRLLNVDVRNCHWSTHPLELLCQNNLLQSVAFTQDETCLDPDRKGILRSWPDLKKLVIMGTDIDEAAGPTLLLQDVLQEGSDSLESLELAYCSFWTDRVISNVITKLPKLQRLSLNGCETPIILVSSPPTSLVSLEICWPLTKIKNDMAYLIALLEASPHLRHFCYTPPLYGIPPVERLASTWQHLETLELHFAYGLDLSVSDFNALKQLLRECHQLQHLHIHNLKGAWWEFFEGTSWGCYQLQELEIRGIYWKPISESLQQFEKGLKRMWAQISQLKNLRQLQMGLQGRGRAWIGQEVRALCALTRMEQLSLVGTGFWAFEDVQWLAESFPWLEEFDCTQSEMSTDLWAWIRRSRESVRFTLL
ncbi:hypothetical protein BGX28_005977 [Mortierella sp. GBA30]|nr:hypothetical protein BGX28_005977 [Mortierella sp. GBA30]